MKKRSLFIVAAISLSLVLALALSEFVLRAVGMGPWRYSLKDANRPTIHEHDAILGWKNKPGIFRVPLPCPTNHSITVTHLADGQRSTGSQVFRKNQGQLVFVGGSYTQGWNLSDHETFPWKIQEHLPSWKVLNYGVTGYGTYQSLLFLEQLLPRLKNPKYVIYGYLYHHEYRNVAPEFWLRALSKHTLRGHVDCPFGVIGDRYTLKRNPPERYANFPLRESLAVVSFAEKLYMKLKTRRRKAQRRDVTEKIFLEMKQLCEKHGAELIVVLLSYFTEEGKDHYTQFFEKNNIMVLDCDREVTRDMVVPCVGHPNAQMNTIWSDCILETLNQKVFKNGEG